MMPALEVLLEAARLGLAVKSVEGNLHVSPAENVTPELVRSLRAHKSDILAALDDPTTTAARIIEAARDFANDLQESWDERMAICTVDGGLSEADAARVALGQILRKMALDNIS